MRRSHLKIKGIDAAVELEIEANAPELRAHITRGVKQAIGRVRLTEMAARQTEEVLNRLMSEEIQSVIAECAERISRVEIRMATKEAVEALFKRWLSSNGGKLLP